MAIYVFGGNSCSQLGLGEDAVKTYIPQRVGYFDGMVIKDISCGLIHTCIIDSEGIVHSWGCNDDYALGRDGDEAVPGPVKLPEKALKIVCGGSFTFCLTEKGNVYGWGTFRDYIGIAGFGFNGPKLQKRPKKIKVRNIVDIVAGHNHIMMLNNRGIVYTMGTSPFGQLGYHVLKRKRNFGLIPKPITNLRGRSKKVIKMFTGASHSFIKFEDEKIMAWGMNADNELMTKDNETGFIKKVVTIPNIKYIKGGMEHTLFIDNNNDLYSVGRNCGNQLGVPDIKMTKEPIKILSNVEQIALTSGSSLAKIEDSVYGWGPNYSGECGREEERISVPTKIDYDFGKVHSIHIGNDFSVIYCDKK
ncbi:Protein pim1 [Dictyocoela muelleri]|nr:Protein pim1 [Dictyocoela muelleri]